MRFGVLGPLEVHDATGAPVEVGSPKLRTLLALLLADAGSVVPVDRILDELWGDEPPATAVGTLQSYVSHLRRLLGPGTVVTRSPGYVLAADDLDLCRFPVLLEEGTRRLEAGDPAAAEAVLTEALQLWRGEPLTDLGDRAAAERARLSELHVVVREQLATARLRSGRADRAVADLERLAAEQPLRERVQARLVEALYATGRQAEALAACRAYAAHLRDELGLDPGPELRALEQAVLRQELPTVALVVPRQRAEEDRRPEVPELPERPLVGRRDERDRLREALGAVTRGRGAVVVLEGEAGIGKTRLAEAATAMAGAQGWRAAWSRCADDAGAPALWPWTQLLTQLDAGPLAAAVTDDPDRTRFSLFQDLRARLTEASAQAPLLVVLDDVQAADATSLQLLALLAQHLEGIRLLVVLTVRTVGEDLSRPLTDCLAALAREPHVQRLQLAGLGQADVRELLPQDQQELAGVVHDRTDGNPFFVVELAQLLRSESGSPDGLPPSVRDVLERRLARLPPGTVELLRLAAVAGRDVELALLQAAHGVDAEQVITLLEPAVAAGVVSEDDVVWQWRFSHALVQETLVAGMSRLTAARAHARLLAALEAAGSVDVERLAHHGFHAVPVLGAEPARRYAGAAAVTARRRLAHSEAAAHTRRALSLLGSGAEAERQALLVHLGDDLLRDGHLLEAHAVVGEALELARALGDPDRMAAAASVWGGVTLWNWRPYGVVDAPLVELLEGLAGATGDAALRARLLGTLAVELAYSDRRDDALAHGEQSVELARELHDPALLGRVLNNLVVGTWSPTHLERRLAATDEAVALSGRGMPARAEFFARLHRGPLRLHLGDATGFVADLSAARRLAASLTGPEVQPYVLYQETGLAMLHGEWERAEELAARAEDLYARTSMWGARFCTAIHQFTFRRREGRLGEVMDILLDACDLEVPLLQDLAVLGAVESGDPGLARRLRRRWPQQLPQDWTTDALVAIRAELALALDGDLAAVEADLLPYSGRQVLAGTAGATWGPYDALLSRLAAARGDDAAADVLRGRALAQGAQVGSPWQAGGLVLRPA